MRLYIVRHAIAALQGVPGIRDDDRPLTEEGIEKMRKAARGLRMLAYLPEIILSSPLIRATQTAEILLKEFGKGELEITDTLAPAGSRADLYRKIEAYGKKYTSLMLVGHQPSLGEIAGEISWGSSECYVEFKKGGACVIELKTLHGIPTGNLIAFLPPSVLHKIAH
jgi:phosphohistidine phosphatase